MTVFYFIACLLTSLPQRWSPVEESPKPEYGAQCAGEAWPTVTWVTGNSYDKLKRVTNLFSNKTECSQGYPSKEIAFTRILIGDLEWKGKESRALPSLQFRLMPINKDGSRWGCQKKVLEVFSWSPVNPWGCI